MIEPCRPGDLFGNRPGSSYAPTILFHLVSNLLHAETGLRRNARQVATALNPNATASHSRALTMERYTKFIILEAPQEDFPSEPYAGRPPRQKPSAQGSATLLPQPFINQVLQLLRTLRPPEGGKLSSATFRMKASRPTRQRQTSAVSDFRQMQPLGARRLTTRGADRTHKAGVELAIPGRTVRFVSSKLLPVPRSRSFEARRQT